MQLNDDMFLFAFYQQAYKSGGFNANSADRFAFQDPYGDEKAENYETGFRSEWFDNRLRVNANVFYSLYQRSAAVAGDAVFDCAVRGESRSQPMSPT